MHPRIRGLQRSTVSRLLSSVGTLGVAALAFCWGRYATTPSIEASPLKTVSTKAAVTPVTTPTPGNAAPSDYAQRAVAYINGTTMISRQELGEYLIARMGAEKLEFLVNKRIIEIACKEKGVDVTAGEVEAALNQDIKEMKVTIKDFENNVLKHYKKSLFEWKEDVVRPKLAMMKLCHDRVKVTAKDLNDAYEAYYGEKVICRMLMYPQTEKSIAFKLYEKIRGSEDEFNRAARTQPSAQLAAESGKIRPIAHHSTGCPEIEREAFSLQPSEVSSVIETPDGVVILKCDARVPADKTHTLAKEKEKLEKEIFDKKLQLEIPKLFAELKEAAKPKIFLKKYTAEEDWLRDIQQDLKDTTALPPTGTMKTKAH